VNIFFNEQNQLRALWRLLFFVVLLFLALVVIGVLASFSGADETSTWVLFTYNFLWFLAIAGATAVAVRVTEHRSFGDVGFGLGRGWVRESAFGFAFGAALLAAAILPAALVGALAMTPGTPDHTLGVALVFFAIAAAAEELLCRGFALQALATGIGPVPASIVMSATFALLHAQNPNVTLVALVATFAAGILLSIAYFRTRTLWLATGVHFGWNIAMGYVFGFKVSGLDLFPTAPLLRTTAGEPVLLTGGDYGPEGSLVVLGMLLFGCAVLAYIPVPRSASRTSREW
jgi:uncharacterized protein